MGCQPHCCQDHLLKPNDQLPSSDTPTERIIPSTRKSNYRRNGICSTGCVHKFWEELDNIGGTILLVLDEIDNVEDPDDILYQISRARKNRNIGC